MALPLEWMAREDGPRAVNLPSPTGSGIRSGLRAAAARQPALQRSPMPAFLAARRGDLVLAEMRAARLPAVFRTLPLPPAWDQQRARAHLA